MTAAASSPELRITVRPMAEPDIDPVSAVRVSGWRYAYAGLMPQEYLDGLSAPEVAASQRTRFTDPASTATDLVAEDGTGRVVGWACFGPARADGLGAGEGELFALYARPDLIGAGVGRALMTEVLLRTASWPGLRLWVVEGNALARRFYERAGFAPDGAVTTDDVGGSPVREVRYHRPRGASGG